MLLVVIQFTHCHIQQIASRENIETLSALEIAEQMTVLDHAILVSIKSE